MTKILWLIGGTTLAIAVFAILNDPDLLQDDSVDGAAGKLGGWGVKQRATGLGGKVLGKVEAFAGNLTGNPDASDQGAFDQATGAVRDAAGQTAQALGNTLRELNK